MKDTHLTTRVETAIATALGCPYGLAGEQAIRANDDFKNFVPVNGFTDEEAELAFIQTMEEAQNEAANLAGAILACETCSGNPHSVDLRQKVCAFALEACTGNVGNPLDINQYLESRVDFGN